MVKHYGILAIGVTKDAGLLQSRPVFLMTHGFHRAAAAGGLDTVPELGFNEANFKSYLLAANSKI